MVEIVVGILAAISITASAGLTAAVIRLHNRSKNLNKALVALQQEMAARNTQQLSDNFDPHSSLSGLRIALAINQDHTIPTFSLLLKEALSSCDAEVTLLDPSLSASLINNWGQDPLYDQPDVLIWGNITCNGYKEFYYRADLNYLTTYGSLNPTSEQPSQGNPQSSLVVTIISKLKKELSVVQRRYDRGRAIKELREEGVLRRIDK